MATDPKEHFVYEANNEEEAEIAQLSALFENEARVREARARLQQQANRPSAEECSDCGEPIPEARRLAVPGVQMCIDCQQLADRRFK